MLLLTLCHVSTAFRMLWINAFGWAAVSIMTAYTGMLIFAKYFDCDPITNKDIKSPDQLFPLYVMDVLGEYKGFPGLFVAGIFSAGLRYIRLSRTALQIHANISVSFSTVSTGMNSLAAIWYAELEGTQFKSNLSSKKAGLTVKALALIFGLSSFAMVFLVPYMGPLVAVSAPGPLPSLACCVELSLPFRSQSPSPASSLAPFSACFSSASTSPSPTPW